MNDDYADLEKRLRRLLPAEVPGELGHRLRAAEPPARAGWLRPCSPGFLAAWFRPWPLAYGSLGAAWTAIFLLHLLTPSPLPADDYVPVAQSSGGRANPAPATLTAGFSLDRAFLFTRSNNSAPLWP